MVIKNKDASEHLKNLNQGIQRTNAADPHRGKTGWADERYSAGRLAGLLGNRFGQAASIASNVVLPDREAWGNIFSGDASLKDWGSAALDSTLILPGVGLAGRGALKGATRLGGLKHLDVSGDAKVAEALATRQAATDRLADAVGRSSPRDRLNAAAADSELKLSAAAKGPGSRTKKADDAADAATSGKRAKADSIDNLAAEVRAADQMVQEAELAARIKAHTSRRSVLERMGLAGKPAKGLDDLTDGERIMRGSQWDNPLGRAAERTRERLKAWDEAGGQGRHLVNTALGFNNRGVGNVFSNSAIPFAVRAVPAGARNVYKRYIRDETPSIEEVPADAVKFSPDGQSVQVVLPDGSMSEPIPTSYYRSLYLEAGGNADAAAALVEEAIQRRGIMSSAFGNSFYTG